MPDLQIVIAANGEKTLRSLAKTYIDFYRDKLNIKIYIYDSKYSAEQKNELSNLEDVEYINEPEESIHKYFRHAQRMQNDVGMPDYVIRGTADDIFLYPLEDYKILKANNNSYIRQECILNFESRKSKKNTSLKGQILNNRVTIDKTKEEQSDSSRCIEMNYYGLHSAKMYLYAVYWQVSLMRSLPDEWYHLTEVLLSVPFRDCIGIWSKKSGDINQRTPMGRNWGKQIPGRRISAILKQMDQAVDIRYIYERYIDLMDKRMNETEKLPPISEKWVNDISDLRKSTLIHSIHRSGSAWQRLGYYAFELICDDIDDDKGGVVVRTEEGNKNNLKIKFALNDEFVSTAQITYTLQA